MTIESRKVLRGYLSSRKLEGSRFPHRVQNLMIREYAHRRGGRYELSATELSVPGSYKVLVDLVEARNQYDGIVFFSLMQLPKKPGLRQWLYHSLHKDGKSLHFCLEQIDMHSDKSTGRVEELLAVKKALEDAPLAGKYRIGDPGGELASLCFQTGLVPESW